MVVLSDFELELLKALYVEHDTPIDRYIKEWEELTRFVGDFSGRIHREFQPGEILHFMMNLRKRGLWPRIRRNYNGRRVKRAS